MWRMAVGGDLEQGISDHYSLRWVEQGQVSLHFPTELFLQVDHTITKRTK